MRVQALTVAATLTLLADAGNALAQGECLPHVEALRRDWRTAAFSSASKPGQMQVPGSGGRAAAAADVAYIAGQLRLAARLCREGQDAAAMRTADAARSMLDGTRPVTLVTERPPQP